MHSCDLILLTEVGPIFLDCPGALTSTSKRQASSKKSIKDDTREMELNISTFLILYISILWGSRILNAKVTRIVQIC